MGQGAVVVGGGGGGGGGKAIVVTGVEVAIEGAGVEVVAIGADRARERSPQPGLQGNRGEREGTLEGGGGEASDVVALEGRSRRERRGHVGADRCAEYQPEGAVVVMVDAEGVGDLGAGPGKAGHVGANKDERVAETLVLVEGL